MAAAEAIYKGATRPAMLLGIPLVPLVVVTGLAMLVLLWGGILWSGWVVPVVALPVLPLFGWMRWTTRQDDQRLRQMFLSAKLAVHDRNRRFWHARSYSPTLYRGARHGWHT